jgi:uncharacterized Zn finger protein
MGIKCNWETIKEVVLEHTYEGKVTDRGTRYILKCKTCGMIIKKDII